MDKKPVVLKGRERLTSRGQFPVTYVQLGALGDLCLSRLNRTVHEYSEVAQRKVFNRICLCDVYALHGLELVDKIYDQASHYSRLPLYFTESAIATLKVTTDALDRRRVLGKAWRNGNASAEVLTKLGQFLYEKYKPFQTDDEQLALLTRNPEESDWIFYLAVPPKEYDRLIERISGWFILDNPERSRAMVLILLEKPFQSTALAAAALASKVRELEEKSAGRLKIFSVDHYATKRVLFELPELVSNIDGFKTFVDDVDEVIVELIEDIDVPDYRMGYMARTGLVFDMMPHVLLPLQFLWPGRDFELTAEPIVFGAYKGYDEQLGNWKEDNAAGADTLHGETYFSLRLNVKLLGDPVRDVRVYVRAGKAMLIERKCMILKRRRRDKSGVEVFKIDIKNDQYEHNAFIGFSLPAHVEHPSKEEKQIDGYTRMLQNAVRILSEAHLPPPVDSGVARSTLELLSVDAASNIVAAIETIREHIRSAAAPQAYPKSKMFVLDPVSENVFVHPSELLDEAGAAPPKPP